MRIFFQKMIISFRKIYIDIVGITILNNMYVILRKM